MISDVIVRGPQFALLSLEAEAFYIRLLLTVDDHGRFSGDHETLKRATLINRPTMKKRKILRWLQQLQTAGLVQLYAGSDGSPVLSLLQFDQKLHSPKASPYPPPPAVPVSVKLQKDEGKEGKSPSGSFLSEEEWLETLRPHFPGVDLRDELRRAWEKRTKKGLTLDRSWFEKKWLPNCSVRVRAPTAPKAPVIPEPPQLWEYISAELSDAPFAPGGADAVTKWEDFDPAQQKHFAEVVPKWSRARQQESPVEGPATSGMPNTQAPLGDNMTVPSPSAQS